MCFVMVGGFTFDLTVNPQILISLSLAYFELLIS